MRVGDPPKQQAKESGRNLRRARRRWDDAASQALALGCVGCADRAICGGLHKKQEHYNCLDDCCGDATTCDSVCPRNMKGFLERVREIDGFDLGTIARAAALPRAELPEAIPLIYHGNRRAEGLDAPYVALPLHKFYRRPSGQPRFSSRAEIEDTFRIAKNTVLVLVGSGRDRPIEAWWGLSEKRQPLIAHLRNLGVSLVTSPNYSLFTDEPRYNDLYNIKRIGIAWQEIVQGGVPAALHINARTDRDYQRVTEFIAERPEVNEIAFEFGTGANWPLRRNFHVAKLAAIPRAIGRSIRLVMIGGLPALPILARAYPDLTVIDTTAFMTALHRQRLYASNDGRVSRRSELTEAGAPVDALLRDNTALMASTIRHSISDARMTAATPDTPPMQTAHENLSSAQDAPSSGQAAAR